MDDYHGFIDGLDRNQLHGWACDRARPDEPVDVELTLEDGTTTVVRADGAREDLRAAGFGNGRHGFRCALPASAALGSAHTVRARIRGTAFELHHSPFAVAARLPLELVAGDIVNNCNLRCPFCIVDYEMVRGMQSMPRATFERAKQLMPLVPDGMFWLSCMHEPTLHPEFIDLIESVPVELRRKISFTSNFCKKLSDDFLRRLADSGVHNVRISFDSMQPELFAKLRKGGRFEVFIDNVTRFAGFVRASARPPRLHTITMAFAENRAEIVALVRRCHEELGAGSHEVRFLSYLPHLAEWGREHLLSLEQWAALRRDLEALGPQYRLSFGDPAPDVHRQFEQLDGVSTMEHPPAVFGGSSTPATYRAADPLQTGVTVPDEDFRLRLRWDGLLMAEQLREDDFRANVLDLVDPDAYFRHLRAAAHGALAPGAAVWRKP